MKTGNHRIQIKRINLKDRYRTTLTCAEAVLYGTMIIVLVEVFESAIDKRRFTQSLRVRPV